MAGPALNPKPSLCLNLIENSFPGCVLLVMITIALYGWCTNTGKVDMTYIYIYILYYNNDLIIMTFTDPPMSSQSYNMLCDLAELQV